MTEDVDISRITTRFAPSPTGRLHLGHGFSAILSHDLARAAGGRFLLRIEDLDVARARAAHVDAIIEDLQWLGLDWDGYVLCQSTRAGAYTAALDSLRRLGLVYRCTCTRADIAASLSAPQGEAIAHYPGTCRARYQSDPDAPFCWRLDMAAALAVSVPLTWGEFGARIAANPAAHGDFIVARKDAPASYHLAVVIDDAHQGVTDVVRGRDLFDATSVQRLLQALLGLPEPRYHHHALIGDADGNRLAKRTDAPSLASLRDAGMRGEDLAEMLRNGRFPFGFAPLQA